MKKKLDELECLVSEMYDDGLSAADMRRLKMLLIDDPVAQANYCRMAATHVAMCVSGSSSAPPSDLLPTGSLSDFQGCEVDSSAVTPKSFAPGVWHIAAAAAALFVVAGLFTWHQHVPIGLGAAKPPLPWTLSSIPVITHVSWEGPTFSTNIKEMLPAAVRSAGTVTLRLSEGKAANGYLFCLPPGRAVELIATFDATGQNSLSIVEIEGDHKSAVKKSTFHNTGEGPKPLHANPTTRNRRYGVLGHWSETNATKQPKYFLLTGVHKLANPSPTEQWRVSETAVLLETESVVYVGWDDSGAAPKEGQAYLQDNDFDDLAASLFFTSIEGEGPSRPKRLRVHAEQQVPDLVLPDDMESGFDFDLPPNTVALITAVSKATDPNTLAVIDIETNEVLWSSTKINKPAYLGTTCLQNDDSDVKHLRLVALHKLPGNDSNNEWRASSSQTLYEQPNYYIFGYEDSRGDGDYDDVRATLLIAY